MSGPPTNGCSWDDTVREVVGAGRLATTRSSLLIQSDSHATVLSEADTQLTMHGICELAWSTLPIRFRPIPGIAG